MTKNIASSKSPGYRAPIRLGHRHLVNLQVIESPLDLDIDI